MGISASHACGDRYVRCVVARLQLDWVPGEARSGNSA